jgi:hypothetical protein
VIDTVLRNADPARALEPDANAPDARAAFTRIVASPRRRPRVVRRIAGERSIRRVAIGGILVGAATTVALAAPMPWNGGAGTSSAAFAVTAEPGGAIRVAVHWDELSDPAALQTALDHAGARIKIRIETATGSEPATCPSGRSVDYPGKAVQYLSPGSANGGFLVRPKLFPPGATFVLTVTMAPAGGSGLSTMPPGSPRIEGWGASMMRDPVPVCR